MSQLRGVDHLRKSFGAKEVLRGIDLAIEPGTGLGVLGANGSGKTTLIKCRRLVCFGPTAGVVSVVARAPWLVAVGVWFFYAARRHG